MQPPALVILAAGMGTRFGGDKQLAVVGPGGATISDYLIYDALRAGFGEIVLVIRPGAEAALDASVRRRFGHRAAIRYVHQRLDDLPGGRSAPASRSKPWGTGQATLAAARTLDVPFAVVNADDFYGAAAFDALATFLRDPANHGDAALVGFPLGETLSAAGGVNRGVCDVTPAGWLTGIREVTGITRDTALAPDTPVSMNMWGFPPAIAPALETAFAAFLERHADDPAAEFLLPDAVATLVHAGAVRVRVLRGPFRWCGVTYPADRDTVARIIEGFIAADAYPADFTS